MARVAPPGLQFHCLHSGGSRRFAALHPRLIRGRPFGARGAASRLSLRLASLGGFALVALVTLVTLVAFFPPRFARRVFSRLVLFCVFLPIGLIGLIGLIAPIGLIALGFLRERLIAFRGFAPLRGAVLSIESS